MPNKATQRFVNECESHLTELFAAIDQTALLNQEKVLNAFVKNNVAARHFNGTTGYGYDDIGRDTLAAVFADIFHTDAAIVSPHILSGTHALSLALFALLNSGDTLLSVSGRPYDTLEKVIAGHGIGSLADFGVNYKCVPLNDGEFDLDSISACLDKTVKVVFIGRSRGYEWRDAIHPDSMRSVISFIKNKLPNVVVFCDNCYGEFVCDIEPSDVGADICVGSLIKNPGGGLASTGAYIVGRSDLIERVSFRLTAPSIGAEIGSYVPGYREFYQGLFIAPHVVAGAIKGSLLISECLREMGYDVLPDRQSRISDIITSVKLDTEQELISFVQEVQKYSPVDGYVTPEPWDMPGYNEPVIMACGSFVQGASLELSCDSPIRKPYIAYLQGGLTYEHVKLTLMGIIDKLNELRGQKQ